MIRVRPWTGTMFVLGLGLAAVVSAGDDERTRQKRLKMVEEQVIGRGIKQAEVIEAMKKVPRHEFVPEAWRPEAYDAKPLPVAVGFEGNLSEPYAVALMTQYLALKRTDKVLEIGTGSGYHTAVLSLVAMKVYSVDIVPKLSNDARARLNHLGYRNVEYRIGDGREGWEKYAPFNAIVLSAAPEELPRQLVDQLALGGRIVVPVGNEKFQELMVFTKTGDGLERKRVALVSLNPMISSDPEPPSRPPGPRPGRPRP